MKKLMILTLLLVLVSPKISSGGECLGAGTKIIKINCQNPDIKEELILEKNHNLITIYETDLCTEKAKENKVLKLENKELKKKRFGTLMTGGVAGFLLAIALQFIFGGK